jgi:hypothetical protein
MPFLLSAPPRFVRQAGTNAPLVKK